MTTFALKRPLLHKKWKSAFGSAILTTEEMKIPPVIRVCRILQGISLPSSTLLLGHCLCSYTPCSIMTPGSDSEYRMPRLFSPGETGFSIGGAGKQGTEKVFSGGRESAVLYKSVFYLYLYICYTGTYRYFYV